MVIRKADHASSGASPGGAIVRASAPPTFGSARIRRGESDFTRTPSAGSSSRLRMGAPWHEYDARPDIAPNEARSPEPGRFRAAAVIRAIRRGSASSCEDSVSGIQPSARIATSRWTRSAPHAMSLPRLSPPGRSTTSTPSSRISSGHSPRSHRRGAQRAARTRIRVSSAVQRCVPSTAALTGGSPPTWSG
ncbi:hypothetical protein ACIBCH_29880 [Amycolatopsis thailandensis]|uniref:hypothetical protein n=1 Tax=Amycolatopsis thailandensis TaxID=589330 RepID=UPI0037AA01D6